MEVTTAVQVKVSFNDELRRFSLLHDASFKQLYDNIVMVCNIDANVPIVIKYMDSEKDMITMSSDGEFREALKVSSQEGIMRLSVSIKALPSVPSAPSAPAYPSLEGELEDLTARTEGASLNPSAPRFYPQWGPHRGGFPHHGPHPHPPHFGMGGPHRGGFHGPHPHPYFGPHGAHGPHAHGPHPHGPHPHGDFHHGPHPHGDPRAPWKAHKKEMKEYMKNMSKEDREKFKEHRKEMKLRWKEMKGNGEWQGCRAESNKLVARHVKDVTITDGTEFAPNTPFVKTWKLRNEGEAWPAGCSLMFISRKGDRMGGPDNVLLEGAVAAGQEVDISVNLVAPSEPGRYTSFYRLVTPDGVKFGQRMWVSIVVSGSSSSSDDEAKYAPVADMIEAMGFHCKRKHIIRLLVKHDNDVDKVVKVLAKKDKVLCEKKDKCEKKH